MNTTKISPAQRFADNLVAANPDATTGELLAMVAPSRRATLEKLLRYVPPLNAGEQAPVLSERKMPIRLRRAVTPLEADLRRRLAERADKPRSRPTGRVDTGCGADNPNDPPEKIGA